MVEKTAQRKRMSLEKRTKWTGEEEPGQSLRQELGRPTGSQEVKGGGVVLVT